MIQQASFITENIVGHKDWSLYFVADGHGGDQVAWLLCDRLQKDLKKQLDKRENEIKNMNIKELEDFFEEIFQNLDKIIENDKNITQGGACLCLALIYKTLKPHFTEKQEEITQYRDKEADIGNQSGEIDKYFHKHLIVANLGDTRAVLLKGEQALRITVDHKASCGDEIKRILAGGGMIYNNRVAGALAVTRSIGDLDFKKCGVIVRPYVEKIQLTQEHIMLIIASDGLWDVVNERDIETFSKIYWSKKGMRSTYSYTVELLAEAIKKGTKDNISVMALAFYDLEQIESLQMH